MGTEDNGLALQVQGLAQRLEALTEKLGGLERENADLRDEVSALRGSGTRRDGSAETSSLVPLGDGERATEFEGRVSRRALLTKAGAAAVAAMAAGTLLYPRQARANHWDSGIIVDFVRTHVVDVDAQFDFRAIEAGSTNTTEALRAENSGSGAGVRALGGIGVWGSSSATGWEGVYGQHTGTSGYGVIGDGKGASSAGVLGRNPDGIGVWGQATATGWEGVYGQHTGSGGGYGVVGDGRGLSYAGVLGRNPNGPGVRGEASAVGHAGVLGKHTGSGSEAIGVRGQTVNGVGVKGTGRHGVVGESPTLGHAAVYGRHTGTSGVGVVGDGTGSEAGVLGRSGSGYGGRFEGGKAQLMLTPKGGTAGKPTTGTHAKGEISMDSAATLWVCTVAGTPGTWRKITTTAN